MRIFLYVVFFLPFLGILASAQTFRADEIRPYFPSLQWENSSGVWVGSNEADNLRVYVEPKLFTVWLDPIGLSHGLVGVKELADYFENLFHHELVACTKRTYPKLKIHARTFVYNLAMALRFPSLFDMPKLPRLTIPCDGKTLHAALPKLLRLKVWVQRDQAL